MLARIAKQVKKTAKQQHSEDGTISTKGPIYRQGLAVLKEKLGTNWQQSFLEHSILRSEQEEGRKAFSALA